MTDLKLKLFDAFLDANDVLFKSGPIVLELSDLLLQSGTLGLLVGVVSLYFFLNAVKLIGESLPCVLLLHCQDGLESLLF